MGYLLIVVGILYGIYSFYNKTKINIYIRSSIEKVTNENGFFKIQFWVSIFNAIFLITVGIVIMIMHLNTLYGLGSILVFHFINDLIVMISCKKGYIV